MNGEHVQPGSLSVKSPYGCSVRILSSVPSGKNRAGWAKSDGGVVNNPERKNPFSKDAGDIFLLTGSPLMDANMRTRAFTPELRTYLLNILITRTKGLPAFSPPDRPVFLSMERLRRVTGSHHPLAKGNGRKGDLHPPTLCMNNPSHSL